MIPYSSAAQNIVIPFNLFSAAGASAGAFNQAGFGQVARQMASTDESCGELARLGSLFNQMLVLKKMLQ